jgi:tetratricopeptide (TPR) repeat protein
MSLPDRRGLPVSAGDQRVVDFFDDAVDDVLGFGGNSERYLSQAFDLDEGLVLGHCLTALTSVIGNASSGLDQAEDSIDRASRVVDSASDREQLHLSAVKAWFESDLGSASRLYQEIQLNHPLDLMALFAGHWLDFYLGDAKSLMGRVAGVLDQWDDSTPGYGYVLGMYAFGLEENGHYDQAEELGRRSVELNPTDAWGVHSVTHVMEMTGRAEEGIEWLQSTLPGWGSSTMKLHNWWHALLLHIDLGDTDTTLGLYDTRLVDDERADAEALADRVSALARLALLDVDVGNRWIVLAKLWEPLMFDARSSFNDLHALLAFHYSDRSDLAEALMECVRKQYDRTAPMMRVGASVLEGVDALFQGDNDAALALLQEHLFEVNLIGGSHAQRDLVSQVTLESAVRAGELSIAKSLLAERKLKRKPMPYAYSRHCEQRIADKRI